MNINRKEIKLEINNQEMMMVLDFESAIYYQENMKESIFVGIQKISKSMDVLSLAYLIASTLRDSNDDIVGYEFVKKLDLIDSTEFFMNKLTELMDNSVPKVEEGNKSKKK